ncbi:hypothetical protein ITI46_02385 [Streptomyces oryzae]|uniref:Uncharacterized protein n=1 Tax=Streptomyces oryzae TaxID=1434886 RepID=A0ABS3X5A6_9ACTN|nr:hypothetical protein [Streptomyces oryzae]MBO8190564.1 hypothetical protein [Streptomyces oryzae]
MRIRTATAAAVLATAAVLGAAGTAAAHDNNHTRWTALAQDFSDHALNARVSSSDNDTTDIKSFSNKVISDNELQNISSGLAIGKIDVD